jgi:NhaP-type Na+/H+ or K+/H+ antiporter
MKKTIIFFVIAALVIFSIILWALNAKLSWNIREILMIAIAFVVVGFAASIGIARGKSSLRKEPLEDELSKKVMTKASSFSYYFSIYFWLFIMYISDKTSLASHTLIGTGILGMAVIFLFSWLGIKLFGMRNG